MQYIVTGIAELHKVAHARDTQPIECDSSVSPEHEH